MGDHSWRTTNVWANSAHWSPEEQAASRNGSYDPRPGYILKLANQQAAATLSERFDAVRTRSLLDELIEGRITTPQQLQHWVDGQTPPLPQAAYVPPSSSTSALPGR